MISASVGFQCPECAKAGAKGQRLVDVHRSQNVPLLTYALMALNVAIYIGGGLYSKSIIDPWLMNNRFGMSGPEIAAGDWWRTITGGFLHVNPIHLAMNMYALYLLGTTMESAIGRVRFGLIYLVALIGGSLGAIVVSPEALTVGASGAIFGLFGAMACLELSMGRRPLQTSIGSTIAINLVFTVVFASFISVGGHVGGLIAGAAAGAILFGFTPMQGWQRRSKPKNQIHALTAAVGALGVVLFVATLVAAPIVTA